MSVGAWCRQERCTTTVQLQRTELHLQGVRSSESDEAHSGTGAVTFEGDGKAMREEWQARQCAQRELSREQARGVPERRAAPRCGD